MKEIEIDTLNLYGLRTLLFIETEPQSNKYCQVILTDEQFKKVSDAIAECFTVRKGEDIRNGFEEISMILSDEEYTLPDLNETS